MSFSSLCLSRCSESPALFGIPLPPAYRPDGGGGTLLPGRHMGGGVIPSEKKEGGGVGGSPPSPFMRSGTRLFASGLVAFRVKLRRSNRFGKVIIFDNGGSFRAGWGRGVPPPGPAHGWGGDPLLKKRRRGGRGDHPPLPLCPQMAPFLHDQILRFVWSHNKFGWLPYAPRLFPERPDYVIDQSRT